MQFGRLGIIIVVESHICLNKCINLISSLFPQNIVKFIPNAKFVSLENIIERISIVVCSNLLEKTTDVIIKAAKSGDLLLVK